jgi:hypothetical protein
MYESNGKARLQRPKCGREFKRPVGPTVNGCVCVCLYRSCFSIYSLKEVSCGCGFLRCEQLAWGACRLGHVNWMLPVKEFIPVRAVALL